MFEKIKQLEAELRKEKDAVIKELLKQRDDIDRQLSELGYVKPKRKRRTKAEMAKAGK